jgi:hypothetical protein
MQLRDCMALFISSCTHPNVRWLICPIPPNSILSGMMDTVFGGLLSCFSLGPEWHLSFGTLCDLHQRFKLFSGIGVLVLLGHVIDLEFGFAAGRGKGWTQHWTGIKSKHLQKSSKCTRMSVIVSKSICSVSLSLFLYQSCFQTKLFLCHSVWSRGNGKIILPHCILIFNLIIFPTP